MKAAALGLVIGAALFGAAIAQERSGAESPPAPAAPARAPVAITSVTLEMPTEALWSEPNIHFAGLSRMRARASGDYGPELGAVEAVGRSRESCPEALTRAIQALKRTVEDRGGAGANAVKSAGVDGPDGTRHYICQQGRLMSVSLVGTLLAPPDP